MHDIIIDDIIEEAKQYGKVVAIKLEIGELIPLLATELQALINDKTNWKVEIEHKRSIVRCTCGFHGNPRVIEKGPDYTLFSCPRCNSIPRVIEGDNVTLKEVRIL